MEPVWEPPTEPVSLPPLGGPGRPVPPWLFIVLGIVLAAGTALTAFLLSRGGGTRGTAAVGSTTTLSTGLGSSVSTPTVPPVGSGYLATGSSYVDFLQWNNQGGRLSGSAQVVEVSGRAPNLKTGQPDDRL